MFDGIVECSDHRVIQGISDDSKDIQKDWLFVLRYGSDERAMSFVRDALDAGGVVLCDVVIQMEKVYICACVQDYIYLLIDRFYGDLCSQVCVIAVTGTSGKTSVASLVSQLLSLKHCDVMQIGTLFLKYRGVCEKTNNTTPDCFQLALYFKKALDLSIPYIVMEVSSHAIDQDRIHFIRFDMILYTNITADHLDYHVTKLHYRYTKFKLRHFLKEHGTIVYNNDLPYMEELLRLVDNRCLCFGTKEAHFPIRDVLLSDHALSFTIRGYRYEAGLLGMMNVYNVCEALLALHQLGISYEALQEDVMQLEPIEGRMEIIKANTYSIWLDYAHTSDALKNLLEFASQVKQGRILSVIGCGGDRDKTKRPQMAELCAKYSDIAIFTTDNPRFEHVYDILHDMCVVRYENARIFENRYNALKHAIKIAQKSDIIIIAGKGNEDYISVRGVAYPFSDRDIIYELIAKEEI